MRSDPAVADHREVHGFGVACRHENVCPRSRALSCDPLALCPIPPLMLNSTLAMDWLVDLFKPDSIARTLLVLSLVAVSGLALGNLRFRGVGLRYCGSSFRRAGFRPLRRRH